MDNSNSPNTNKNNQESSRSSTSSWEDDYVNLPNGKKLHSIRGGDTARSNRIIVLLHGANREVQNAEYWRPQFEFLATQGTPFTYTFDPVAIWMIPNIVLLQMHCYDHSMFQIKSLFYNCNYQTNKLIDNNSFG